jgi:hypothetical protein
MTELVPIAHLPFRVPCFLASYDPMTFALIFAGPALAALLVVRALRRGPAAVDAAAAVSLGALALAVVPQALGRSDCHHALAALIPGALLVAALPYTFGPRAGRRWSPGTLAAALLVLAFFTRALKDRYPPEGPLFAPQGTVVSDGSPFTRGIASPHAEERRHLREYLSTLLKPGEAVFAGNRNHSLLAANDADLFFVLDRPSVTRYMQFDPGIITRAPVQREVIADLERKRPRVAILNSAHTWTEKENDSSKPGATLLDEYLNQHYHRVESFGTYEVHVRNP